MSHHETETGPFGMVALFETPEALLAAAHKTREAGYTVTDCHTPIPVHGLAEALGMKRSKIAGLVLAGGTLGGIGGFSLQYWVSAIEYPLNVGGRPYFSWPSFIPIIFECIILGAALTTIFSLMALNGLPQPYHPVFDTPDFDRASNDGFFLAIEAADPRYDADETRAFLSSLNPSAVNEVTPS